MRNSLVLGLATAVLLAACGGDADDSAGRGKLRYAEAGSDLTGSYVTPEGVRVTFSSRMVGERVLELVVRFNDVVLTEIADGRSGVIEYDGFGAETGGSTQMRDEDRDVLLAFTQALSLLRNEAPRMLDAVRRFVGTWAEFPSSLDLQGIKLAEANRSWQSLCGYQNTYYPATHDCQYAGDWSDQTSLSQGGGGYLSLHGDQGGQDGTRFWIPWVGNFRICINNWWGTSCDDQTHYFGYTGWNGAEEISHDSSIEYAYGNCFGVCGAGCDGSDFTVDCQNHDQCVRFGHVTASGYCDDEFSATIDDAAPSWLGGAPNC